MSEIKHEPVSVCYIACSMPKRDLAADVCPVCGESEKRLLAYHNGMRGKVYPKLIIFDINSSFPYAMTPLPKP